MSGPQNGKPDLREYRQHLVLAEQKAQDDYDKTLVLLAGGALGLSFAFVDKFIGPGPVALPGYLFFAWLLWVFSLGLVLTSFLLSRNALRFAIQQTDSGTIYSERIGGRWALRLTVCNVSAGIFFLTGVLFMAVFVWHNLGNRHV